MKRYIFNLLFAGVLFLQACSDNQNQDQASTTAENNSEQVVNVYTHRHYETDQRLFDRFTETTGIKVNVVSAGADELIKKLELEGERSPADVLITVDAGRLHRAEELDLLQPISSSVLDNNVPSSLKDPEGYWYGLTYRARVIVYAKDRVKPGQLSTYEDLTQPKWKGKVLTRSSDNIYNQSLLASIVASEGPEKAKNWARGLKNNFAREPKGSDRDQVKAVAEGQGDVAIVNTYYLGLLLNSDNEEERKAGEAVGVFFPNQNGRGTHINISGAGVTKHAPNKENAIRFIEFLTQDEAQKAFAEANFEYPVKKDVEVAPLLKSWGDFKVDSLNLAQLGEKNREAVMIFDEIGWK
ncbi:Fe(3+) ABC transporter substrate-binding protein [soil metagenome]